MSSLKKETVMRGTRLTAEMNSLLENDARSKRMTVSALISSILTKYAEWDRFTERFGFVSISRQAFRQLIDGMDEDKLTEIAKDLANQFGREVILFWYKKVNIETVLALWGIYCKYTGLAEYELARDRGDHTVDFHHELGEKWSIFLKYYFDGLLRNLLGISAQFDHTKNGLVVRFQLPSDPAR